MILKSLNSFLYGSSRIFIFLMFDPGGPFLQRVMRRLRLSSDPSMTASISPLERFLENPKRASLCDSSRINALKKTPCTSPEMKR